MYLGGELVYEIFLLGGVFYFLRDVVRTFCIFYSLSILDTLYLHCNNLVFILLYILRLLSHSFTYLYMCCFFSLFMHILLNNYMKSSISISH